ncbi:hypothetical protein BH09PSE1_BH09PSE1_12370 [soil metagenome]
MPGLPINLPPHEPAKRRPVRPILHFIATFVAVFLAALLVLHWL